MNTASAEAHRGARTRAGGRDGAHLAAASLAVGDDRGVEAGEHPRDALGQLRVHVLLRVVYVPHPVEQKLEVAHAHGALLAKPAHYAHGGQALGRADGGPEPREDAEALVVAAICVPRSSRHGVGGACDGADSRGGVSRKAERAPRTSLPLARTHARGTKYTNISERAARSHRIPTSVKGTQSTLYTAVASVTAPTHDEREISLLVQCGSVRLQGRGVRRAHATRRNHADQDPLSAAGADGTGWWHPCTHTAHRHAPLPPLELHSLDLHFPTKAL